MESFFTDKGKKIILFMVFAMAIFLIVFDFTETPMPWVDEGVFTETAKNLATHGVLGLQTEPGSFFPMNNFLLSTSYPVIFPVAGSFLLFGTGIWQARLPMIIYMVILVILFYLFTRKKYGFYPAILSVLALLSFSPFYGNGRPVQGEVPGVAFLVLGAYLTLFWEESNFKSKKFAIFTGLAFGLSAVVKPLFLLGVSLSLMIALLFWVKRIDKKNLLLFGSGFILPVLVWIQIHLPTMDSILKLIPNYLYFSGNHTSSISAWQTISINFTKFFTESTPILFMFLLIVTVISFGFRFIKKESKNFSISEVIVISFIILNWVGFMKGTGWYRYFFPAHTLIYLLFSGAILNLGKYVNKPFLKNVASVIVIVLIIFQFFHLVFLSDTRFTSIRDRSSELSSVFSEIKPNQSVLFYSAMEATVFLKGDNYSQYLSMGGFLKMGDENSLVNPSADFVLVRGHGHELPCYQKTEVNRYDFFRKIDNCIK